VLPAALTLHKSCKRWNGVSLHRLCASMQVDYLQSIPLHALETVQAHLLRVQCLFDYTQREEECSPYAALLKALQLRIPLSRAAMERDWSL
jgi:hypothetical protein